ncbi:PilT domain-containing protein [mine drainage metagenome]|uniref:PilT domain-containing protein n=1 Tax=mine drainage metagenome TaxID=410659 RepID=T1BUD8_9ZZZZ
MMVVDTNIFLETMLNQNRADECETLLKKIAIGELSVVVSRFSIHAIEAIIGKGELIGTFLRDVNSSIGLRLYDTNTQDEIAVTLFQEASKLDFDDALQYFVAKKLGAESIISFDRDFDNLDIKRLEPNQVI